MVFANFLKPFPLVPQFLLFTSNMTLMEFAVPKVLMVERLLLASTIKL
jgi:hypothetical protein